MNVEEQFHSQTNPEKYGSLGTGLEKVNVDCFCACAKRVCVLRLSMSCVMSPEQKIFVLVQWLEDENVGRVQRVMWWCCCQGEVWREIL